MFLENSRYLKTPTVETTLPGGRTVTALKRRALDSPSGEPHAVKDNDQLDVLAEQQYADGTRFWRIADANTALQANDLVAETGAILLVPKQ